MPLTPGGQIGPYKILSLLGKGGMGEVYRARDTRLNRDVAIKILPAHLAPTPSADAERLARFEREARILAALSHPHIAAIYGLEDHAIVMELVEGPTLAERIASGLTLEASLTIALQIAEGLEAAHEKGIVHRDLKPANVKAPVDAPVKVLDLGLATAIPRAGHDEGDPETSPTITMAAATEAGMILGTAAYMSPEQASGKRADKRADIWSFGVVLWEMLTGKRLFEAGESISHTLADVLRSPIDFTRLPASTPAPIVQLLKRCLDRNLKTRLRDIGEARVTLAAYLANPADADSVTAPADAPPSASTYAAWIVAALFAVLAAGLAYLHFHQTAPSTLQVHLALPDKFSIGQFAISPDGRMFALTGRSNGKQQLWLRSLGSPQFQLVAGSEGAAYPFWSPDNRDVAFFAQGKLKKVSAAGGPPQSLCDAAEGRGGSWNTDGLILFSAVEGGGFSLRSVSSASGGGASSLVVKPPKGIARFPVFLPGGHTFLYVVTRASVEENGIYFRSLDGKENRRLLSDESSVVVAAGRLLFVRDSTLLAQSLDVDKGQVLGEPVSLAPGVVQTSNVIYAPVTASETGLLVYQADGSSSEGRRLLSYDRPSKTVQTPISSPSVEQPAFSPDRKSIAFMRLSPTGSDLWTFDLARKSEQLFQKDPSFSETPIYSPTGDRIAFQSNRLGGIFNLYVRASSGVGQDEPLLISDSRKTPTQWTHDGRFLVYSEIDQKTRDDIWVLPLENGKPGKAFPFLHTEANEDFGQISPDGHWMAYTSDVSGRPEVYIRSFPGGEEPQKISIDGGDEPRWREDGKELYFVGGGNIMVAALKPAALKQGTSLEAGLPAVLFTTPPVTHYNSEAYDFDVSPNGQQFLLIVLGERPGSTPPLNIVVNWDTSKK